MNTLLLLLTVYRMIVIPVQFEDRAFDTTPEQQQDLVAAAAAYFNRQYDAAGQFRFDLAPAVTLSHPTSWYGANYSDRKDIRIHEALREACSQLKGQVDFSLYDPDGDGTVDQVFLLTAGPAENDGGGESALWPQQGRLSARNNAFNINGLRIDGYGVSPEGKLGLFCHEFGHTLGLEDLYDSSGSIEVQPAGLWGTSLMDAGCLQPTPPDFTAVEYEQLGLGSCEALTLGSHTLAPLSQERRYLKAATEREDEYFLFECRDGALRIYHIDPSASLFASLVPADPDAATLAAVSFPQPGFDSFGSDTPSPFRSRGGCSLGLALVDFSQGGDGSIRFEVIEPIVLTETSVYQDAAVIRWETSPALDGIRGFEFSWSDGQQSTTVPLGPGALSYTLEGLSPQTGYSFSIQVRTSEHDRYSVGGSFITKMYRSGTYPYIYLSGVLRNADGSFPPGSRIPLRVFNATDVQEVHWSLDGIPITPGPDGRYTLERSGTLRARILHRDGSTETLLKEILIQ